MSTQVAPSQKIVAYIFKKVDGNWSHFYDLAAATLKILGRTLIGDLGVADNFTMISWRYFKYPNNAPNILELDVFFAEETNLDNRSKEIKSLYDQNGVPLGWAMPYFQTDYYVARVVGAKGKRGPFNNDLNFYLREFEKMHKIQYVIVSPNVIVSPRESSCCHCGSNDVDLEYKKIYQREDVYCVKCAPIFIARGGY